jgi:ribosomal protein S18 acetylase RimI-like enzyme
VKPNQHHLVRLASMKDLDELVWLENAAFHSDRFHRDRIEYLLTRSHGTILVLEDAGAVVGAAYLLWRRTIPSGRLYNLAVHPAQQGKGFGALLLRESELESARRGCTSLLLEVRADNTPAIGFYKQHGYETSAVLADYYDDHTAAFKMTRPLGVVAPPRLRMKIPYHAQMLDFTCGPACLMMAMKHFNPDLLFNRTLEINLWREATLVFMTAGIGGTGPYGLALSARKRGLDTRLLLSTERIPFQFSVRYEKKREIIEIAHDDLRRRATEAGVTTTVYDFTFEDIGAAIYRGYVPIVLISAYRLTGDRAPHWVVMTGFDRKYIYLHDPDLDSYHGDRRRARQVKILRDDFQRVSRYGKVATRSAILVGLPN